MLNRSSKTLLLPLLAFIGLCNSRAPKWLQAGQQSGCQRRR
jgi:hypothetical protein